MAAILDLLNIAWTRFSTNLRGTLDGMSTEKWIRLVIIVGAYCLLRPYLMKLAGNSQMKQHDTRPEDEWHGPKAKVQPNTLRGQVEIPEDSDDEAAEVTGSTTATEWGKKARRRQREVLKKLIDVEEKKLAELQEDDEDKDIEEFLVKE